MAIFWKQIKLVDLPAAEKNLAKIPGYALVDEGITATQSIENFKRPFRKTDRSRT